MICFGIGLDWNEYGGGCVIFLVLGIILVVGCSRVVFLFSFLSFFVAACFVFCIKIVVFDLVDVVGELLVIALVLLGVSDLE